jgi:endogenous inhibitor of DNA gyrase (YacG/DUF329 family)
MPRSAGSGEGKAAALHRSTKCPICDKPSAPALDPFCSKRCANIDLSRWLSGSYAIPGRPADEADDNSRQDNEGDDGES